MSLPKKILLTGASGFAASHLLEEAARLSENWSWIGTDRQPQGTTRSVPDDYQFHTADLSQMKEAQALLQDSQPDVVIHLAGWTGKSTTPENRNLLFQSNSVSTWNLLSCLAPQASFLLASTGLVYGNQEGPFTEDMPVNPPDEYSLCKYMAEQAVRTWEQRELLDRACIVRPAILYGPGQRGSMFVPSLCQALVAGQEFPMTQGEQLRDLVHVRDFANAILTLILSGTRGTYNIGSGAGVQLRDIADLAERLSGKIGLVRPGAIPYRKAEVWQYSLSPQKIHQTCGWMPRISLEEGLAETLAFHGAQQ